MKYRGKNKRILFIVLSTWQFFTNKKFEQSRQLQYVVNFNKKKKQK